VKSRRFSARKRLRSGRAADARTSLDTPVPYAPTLEEYFSSNAKRFFPPRRNSAGIEEVSADSCQESGKKKESLRQDLLTDF